MWLNQRNPICKARNFVWGKPPADPNEAKLLRKIDWFVLSFVCLNYWINYVDRSNFANAYVSGMQEELKMKGFEFNTVNTCFTVGYIVGMIPNNVALLKLTPRYWLAFCSFAWALLTLGMYRVNHYNQLCAIRFFQALFESSTFSGTHLILGSWYKETELAKRSAIFTSSGLVGNIFSGFMQSAIHKHMDGKRGLSGWRWLFIIDFLITLPICLYGLLCFPDVPEKCSSRFFTLQQKQLAITRLPQRPPTKLDLSVFKRVLGKWHWWGFTLLWAFGGENESFATNSLFALWLKKFNYSVSSRNNYPLGIYAVGILSTFAAGLYVDNTGARYHWHVAVWITAIMLIASILLVARPLETGCVFAAHYLSGVAYSGQAVYFAWSNVVCYDDLEERAIILASMNMFSSVVNAWWPLLFYKASDAPKFKKGCYAMFATIFATAFIAAAIRFLHLRETRSRHAEKLDTVNETSDHQMIDKD